MVAVEDGLGVQQVVREAIIECDHDAARRNIIGLQSLAQSIEPHRPTVRCDHGHLFGEVARADADAERIGVDIAD